MIQWTAILFFFLQCIIPAEDCSITEIPGNVLGCALKDKQLNIAAGKNVTVPTDTTCVFENQAGVNHIICDVSHWEIIETLRNQRNVRRKRSRGRFWRGVGNVFKRIAKGVVCVLTLLSCLWGGRAGPVDHTPPGIVCRPPLIHAVAEPYQTYAKVSWAEPTAQDETDGLITPRRKSGRASGRHFPRGKTTVTYEAKDRAGNTAQCTINIIVKVIECDPPTNLENGYFQCHPVTEFLYGGGCRFGCYEGFDLHGSDRIECLRTGQWSSAQPVCKPWKCPDLPRVDGAGHAHCTREFSFRSICSYNCDTGFDMPPKVSKAVVCDKTKTWRKHGEPMCIDVEPPVFDTCPSIVVAGTDTGVNSTIVNWKEPDVRDNSNTAHRYMKHGVPTGSRLTAGMYTIQYGAKDGGGNVAIRDCSFKVIVREILCPKLYPTPFVHISCPDGYRSGARCNISCDPGKVLFGSDNVGCNKSPHKLFGDWNWKHAQQAICKNGKKCVTMQPPRNGALVCDNWEWGQFCQVQCKNGTEMASVSLKSLYVCDETGNWLIDPPKSKACKEVRHHHVQHTLGISAYYYFNGDCTDPSTQQQIANNFIAAINATLFQPEICPATSSECNSRNVQIICGQSSRRRRETLNSTHQNMDIEINFDLFVTMGDAESLFLAENRYQLLLDSVKDFLEDKQNDIFIGTTVGLKELSSTGLKIHCPKGSVQSEQSFSCIDCPEGTFYANRYDSVVCEACRKGFFQDEVAQTMCIRCPFGKTTQTIGARSVDECEDACMPGSYSRDGLLPCSPCEQGYYQSSYGHTSCHECRDSKTTLTFGAVSASECEEFDIAFVPEEQSEVHVNLQDNVTITEFTVSFWFLQSTRGNSSEDSFPSVKLSDKHGDDVWIWENMRNIKHQNNMNVRVDFGLPDSHWHHIIMYRSQICNISVSVDGMYVPVEETYHGRCTDITFNTLSVSAVNNTTGSFSQFNIWHGKHNMGYRHRCFSGEIGDVVSWRQFEEAENVGAYLYLPSECDDFDNCVSSPCLYGTCDDDLHGFICTCRQGYRGTQCDINMDDCETSICMNNATCVDGVADYTCSCPASYTGQYCEIEMVDGEWSDWGNWSECSTTCGDGEKKRQRLCTNPSPDNGGEFCVGDPFGFKHCNNTDCPVCPPISAPVNGSLDCFNDTESINCTMSCNDGFDFDSEPLPQYYCGPQTFQEWNYQTDENPERSLPKCIAIKLPDELKVQYSAYYKDLYCANTELENLAREQIELVVKSMLLNVPCVVKGTCSIGYVNINDCDANSRQRRSVNTAGFTLQITSNPTQDNTNETLTDLENAFQDIQGAADNGDFTVDVLDDDYELDANLTDLSGEVVCGPGETRVKFYCVPCGQGAYLSTDYCKPCPIGTYQDTEGQSSCNNCPMEKSTVGIRSISLNDCTVDIVVPLEEGLKVTGIIVGVVSAVVVMAVASFVYRRYRSKRAKLVFPTDINMTARSPTSMSSDARELGPSKKIFEPHTLNIQSSTPSIRHADSDSETECLQGPDMTGKYTPLGQSCTYTTADGQVVHIQPWK